jgi:GxxExxY protein
LQIALKTKRLEVETQKRIDIFFKNEKVGIYIPDIIVNGKIIVELKCKPFLTKGDIDQFWKYLKGSEYKLGFLINFGQERLIIKRVVYDTARSALIQRQR